MQISQLRPTAARVPEPTTTALITMRKDDDIMGADKAAAVVKLKVKMKAKQCEVKEGSGAIT